MNYVRAFILILSWAIFPVQALVILQYHHIDSNTPPSTSTSPADFATHLALIDETGMQVVDLKEALITLQRGGTLPDNALAITFDDAYLSIYQRAWPLLKERRWPFTIFVNPNAVDRAGSNTISWAQLKEMQDAGVLIANHGQTHAYLIDEVKNKNLAAYLETEINGAEKRLYEKLGTSHKIFAYPYGEFTLEIANWLKQQGYLALGQQSGAVGTMTNMQAIPRYPAGGIYANPKTLKTKLHTLPFSISGEQFVEPVLTAQHNPPKLALRFPATDTQVQQIQCYSGTENAIPTVVTRVDQQVRLETQARQTIRAGRDRYNCTAPSKKKPGWYYWYSQYWINPNVKNR